MSKKIKILLIQRIDILLMGFIFLILFVIPILFTRVGGSISWRHVLKIWQDLFLLIPIFAINHWLLGPSLMLRKKYLSYMFCIFCLIAVCTFSYYYYDEILNKKPTNQVKTEPDRPKPIPPYAHLLMYSLLIVGVDTGLLFSKKWQENEENKHLLEQKNTEMQLDILRNQISPHFFMNTLNNIYALIDSNSIAAKEAVMKLSKLMRYMLYENENGKVKLSKEFEFVNSYIDLMKLRFADEMKVYLIFPNEFTDTKIPSLLFISYIENAFKYGASYQQESFVNIVFEISGAELHFMCTNSRFEGDYKLNDGGLGLKNNENRLKLLYGNNYKLSVNFTDKLYNVSLAIPLQ
jgi:hypothetical protein